MIRTRDPDQETYCKSQALMFAKDLAQEGKGLLVAGRFPSLQNTLHFLPRLRFFWGSDFFEVSCSIIKPENRIMVNQLITKAEM